VIASGRLIEASCETSASEPTSTFYRTQIDCRTTIPGTCGMAATNLAPGLWQHSITAVRDAAVGQRQTRRSLLMHARSGEHMESWPLFPNVATVTTLSDRSDCNGCLREALDASAAAVGPMLIQFAPELNGSIVLAERLPDLCADQVTIDARGTNGLPYRITLDANGMRSAALRITGSRNRVIGLRVIDVGGDADIVAVEGAGANGNVLDSLQVIGRAGETCELLGQRGCLVDGVCLAPNEKIPRGDCGDDGIAIRNDAGASEPNLVVDADVSGAFDKGIKVSDGAVAIVERSWVHNNADGGIQTTLGGDLTARENISENNLGTGGASGIAANGPRLDSSEPARLTTRGNIVRSNALRGLSVRSLSIATLRDDYVCGNQGFGLATLAGAGFSPTTSARGLAIVRNVDGGAFLLDQATTDLGRADDLGRNLFAYNGTVPSKTPVNALNLTALAVEAAGNHWEHCGRGLHCNESQVGELDVFSPDAKVTLSPALPAVQRQAPRVVSITPAYAAAGDLVRIYGTGFDAVGGNSRQTSCESIAEQNGCPPRTGNCVFFDGEPAEVIAVTPTMLVVRAPFTCAAPVQVAIRTRWSRGLARATFCVVGE
jgi:hypothetical protein